ncbi:MAG: DHH family phosphoesterase [Gemmatimonadetes bacterium]|nr:DHH family phosphoesterase [Gemmatimonadota bacterium]
MPSVGTPDPEAESRLLELLGVVDPSLEVGIFSHDNPDPDAIASAFCLQHLLTEKLGARCVLGFAGMVGRHENQAMIRHLGLAFVPLRLLDFRRFGTVALVDTQPGTGNNSLPPDVRLDIVLDHHPLRKESRRARFADVRPDYGSTSTLLFGYLQAARAAIPSKLATAILLGIKSDTRELERSSGERDVRAYLEVFPQADLALMSRIEHPRISRRYFQSFWEALSRSRVHGDAVISALGDVDNPDMVAQIAEFLLPLEEVRFAMALGRSSDRLFVSLRTRQQQHDAGQMLQRVLKGIGKAGGHGRMAGGQVDLRARADQRRGVEERIVERFLEETGIADREGAPLVATGCVPGTAV